MTDATRRGLRTALQILLTLLVNGALFGALKALGVDVTPEQYAAVSAVLLPFVTTAVNGLEDRGTIPAVLKAPASDGKDPVPDTPAPKKRAPRKRADAGESLLGLIGAILLIIGLVLVVVGAIHNYLNVGGVIMALVGVALMWFDSNRRLRL